LYNSDYEELTARFELYEVLKQGLDDIEAGRTIPADEFLAELEARNSGSKK
jgi:predicted transcriptional regulator